MPYLMTPGCLTLAQSVSELLYLYQGNKGCLESKVFRLRPWVTVSSLPLNCLQLCFLTRSRIKRDQALRLSPDQSSHVLVSVRIFSQKVCRKIVLKDEDTLA